MNASNSAPDSARAADPFDLSRFVAAQQTAYASALSELREGQKRSHWIWFVFPQFRGLGRSSTAQHFAIQSLEEAHAYADHPLLGPRLLECARALLGVEGRTARQILGSPDDLKVQSCATLFAAVSPANSEFEQLLRRYYQGRRDEKTLELAGLGAKS